MKSLIKTIDDAMVFLDYVSRFAPDKSTRRLFRGLLRVLADIDSERTEAQARAQSLASKLEQLEARTENP